MSIKWRGLLLVVVAIACFVSIEAGRGGFRSSGGSRTSSSGGWRTSSSGGWGSSSRSSGGGWNSYSSSRRATPSPSNSGRYAGASPTRSSYSPTQRAIQRPTQSSPVVKPPVYVHPTQHVTLSRQPSRPTTARSYPSQNYPSQSYPSQSYPKNYNQPSYRKPTGVPPKSVYNPSYGGNYNSPNYGSYRPNNVPYQSYSPYYTPQYSKYPNLYQVGKYKDHSVRNSVLAGLGGSALGMYLGYKLGSYTSHLNNPIGYQNGYSNQGMNYGGSSGGPGYTGFPSYSVVHHYHHGDKTIPQTFEVKENTITKCGNIDICTPNTTPLCMTNGTVYCVAPISSTSNCNETSLTHLPCLNTTFSVPCVNASDPNCKNGVMLNETIAVPCVSNISVYGDFNSNKLEVHTLAADNSTSDTTVTGQGIKNNFCVTVIADPVKIPENLNNHEFLWYLEDNPKDKEIIHRKTEDTFSAIMRYLFI